MNNFINSFMNFFKFKRGFVTLGFLIILFYYTYLIIKKDWIGLMNQFEEFIVWITRGYANYRFNLSLPQLPSCDEG